MSWAYWAPKSTTRQVGTRRPGRSRPSAVSHHDELGLLQLLQRLEAAQRHGPPQRPGEVDHARGVVRRPVQDLLSGPWTPTRTRFRPGAGWGALAGMLQCQPRPGASVAAATVPVMTAPAPHATARAMSPPVVMPPTAITWQQAPVSSRAHAGGAGIGQAVARGTPTPSTSRVTPAAPLPAPTSTPAAPVRMSGGPSGTTCTRPPARQLVVADEGLEVERLDCAHVLGRHDRRLDDQQVGLGPQQGVGQLERAVGVTATAVVTSASLIWAMRSPIRWGLTGSA